MTVIVEYENGKPLYQSIDGPGSSEADREKARKLDYLVEKEMKKLANKVSDRSIKKGTVETYWKFGRVLRDILYSSGLVKREEQVYFEKNVRLHAPSVFLAKDRSADRRHIDYCMRLASYDKEKAMKMKWGEWVELFDRNKEARFDEWFDDKTASENKILKRKFIRRFTKAKNAILQGIETKDLEGDELYRCYEASWLIAVNLEEKEEKNVKDFQKTVLQKMKKNKNAVGGLISGSLSPEAYQKNMLSI